ncbi:MAG: SdpI family protein [Clostridia bacterium]|nr:SdpI family protein [Clostridia bacterium]
MKNLMKAHKWKLLASSLLILLPMLFGSIVWKRLPEALAIHWGLDGRADGFAHPFYAVFFLPLFLLLTHGLCLFITVRDKQNKGQSRKVLGMVFWILPVVSLYSGGVIYAAVFGMPLSPSLLVCSLVGAGLILFGNYLPKCRRNRTVGIKLKWTLQSEENWNGTHRFAGKVWVVCGLLALGVAFLPKGLLGPALAVILFTAVLLPTVYSYRLYKRLSAEGRATDDGDLTMAKSSPKALIISIVAFGMVMTLLMSVLLFTGDVNYNYRDDRSFVVSCSFYGDLTVEYEDIVSIEYREEGRMGDRLFGIGSLRLSVGRFENEEFGEYLRYSYTACKATVVLKDQKGQVFVLGRSDAEKTRALYEELLTRYEKAKGEET